MRPVLFDLAGLEVQSYGVSKALAALVAGWLIYRELGRRGRNPDLAYSLTLWGVVAGFVGAKLFYLAENAGSLMAHDFGGSGFTFAMGAMRFLVEFARINPTVAVGLSQPQLWSLALAGLGIALILRHNSTAARSALRGGSQ